MSVRLSKWRRGIRAMLGFILGTGGFTNGFACP